MQSWAGLRHQMFTVRAGAAWLLALALALAATAAPALGGGPVRGSIVALADRVPPGGTFVISGLRLDPGAEITFALRNGTRTVPLGAATVRADGTLDAMGTVPNDWPTGYSELVSTSSDSGEWVASVLVGEPAASPEPGFAVDSQVVAIAVMGVGLVIFVVAGAVFLRARPRSSSSPD